MLRVLIILLIIIIVLLVCAYFLSGIFLQKGTQRALAYITAPCKAAGINLYEHSFGSVRFSAFNAIVWKNISAKAKVKPRSDFMLDRNVSLDVSANIDEIKIIVESFKRRSLLADIKNINLVWKSSFDISSGISKEYEDELSGDELKIKLILHSLDRYEVTAQVKDLFSNLIKFITEGKTEVPIHFSGASTFTVRKKPIRVKFWMEQKDEEFSLVVDKEGLRTISKQLQEELTEGEIDLLSKNPMQISQLLRIRDYGQLMADKAFEMNPFVPKDAFRHVLWSYILTKVYGPEFAKNITDAYEIGAVDRTEAQRDKNIVNSALGRRYVRMGYSESSILEHLMEDLGIPRIPGELIK